MIAAVSLVASIAGEEHPPLAAIVLINPNSRDPYRMKLPSAWSAGWARRLSFLPDRPWSW